MPTPGHRDGTGESPQGRYLGASRVATAAQMQALDRKAIDVRGVPSLVLMENASRAVADRVPELRGTGEVVVLCGPGNNGGDGLAIARALWNRGQGVRLVRVGDRFDRPDRLPSDVQAQLQLLPDALTRSSLNVRDQVSSELEAALLGSGLIVDAVFGIGLTRAVESSYALVLQQAMAAPCKKLGVDLPSGLHADTGEVLGPCLECSATVTFAAWKHGLRRGSGPRVAGQVHVAEIGIPLDLLESLDELEAGA